MDANFFQAPDPSANPQDFAQRRAMAQALMQQGGTSPQGKMVGGVYTAPNAGQYASQLGSAALGGMQMNKINEAQRASTLLNGGTPQAAPFAKFGSWIGGLLGGA